MPAGPEHTIKPSLWGFGWLNESCSCFIVAHLHLSLGNEGFPVIVGWNRWLTLEPLLQQRTLMFFAETLRPFVESQIQKHLLTFSCLTTPQLFFKHAFSNVVYLQPVVGLWNGFLQREGVHLPQQCFSLTASAPSRSHPPFSAAHKHILNAHTSLQTVEERGDALMLVFGVIIHYSNRITSIRCDNHLPASLLTLITTNCLVMWMFTSAAVQQFCSVNIVLD